MSQRSVEPAEVADAWRLFAPLPTRQSACCCSARPTVRVVVPVYLGRAAAVELLLCTHHFRSGIVSLERIGAAAFDARGALLMPRSWNLGTAGASLG